MKLKILLIGFLCIIVLIGVSLGNPETSVKIMKVSDIRIGMKGYGRTVFEGTKIEKFDIEVMGVLKNGIGPKLDMILIRCKHPVTDKAGVIAGMSGSPIYVVEDPEKDQEGKLIGALSYGFGDYKEAIAGVTPIESMLEDFNRPPEKTGYNPNMRYDEKFANNVPLEPAIGQVRSLQTPLYISGVTPKRLKQLEKYLAPYNMLPVQGGSASAELKEKVSKKLEPGSAIGVTLVRGDEEWTGIGTVTYCEGDKFLAFGHPMSSYGELSIPATNAYIYGVYPNIRSSFKLGSGVDTIGIMTQDQRTSISGVVNKTVGMVPVKIAVENVKTHARHEFNYEIVKHRQIMGSVLPNLMSAATDVEPMPESGMVEVITLLKLKGADPVSFRRLVTGDASGGGCGSVNNVFLPIWENPYKEIEVDSISFEVKVTNENRSGFIQKAWLDQKEVEPGETITVTLMIRPYLKEAVLRPVIITIPKDMAPQDINITICGGNSVSPELPPPTSTQELIKYLKSYYDSDSIVAIIPLQEIDVRMQGQSLPKMPNSIMSQIIHQTREPVIVSNEPNSGYFGATLDKPIQLARKSLRFIQPSEFVIYGSVSVPLRIVKHKNIK
jgi:hypothetical protein